MKRADRARETEVAASGTSDDTSASGDLADARHAITGFAGYVNNADTKAGLAAAAVAALVAGVAQQGDALRAALTGSTTTARVALIFLVLLAAAIMTVVVGVGVALVPRTPTGSKGGRFSYPMVAEDDWQFSPATRPQAAAEAWAQARTLARILKRKYAGIKVAVYALGAAFVMFCGWTVAAALL